MKLLDIKTDVQTVGEQESIDFKIDVNPRTFKTLISNLYSNAIKAVVRELSTNAYDSHVEAGCPQKPFEVNLPTNNNPVFSIRDFGTGLSPDNIENVYVFFFRSDKVDDNNKVGCFGLGSKSPLAYADAFTVESYYNGKKVILVPHIGTDFVPRLNYLTPKEGIPTDEPNGVKVSINVDTKDIMTWASEAATIYSGFKVKPKINRSLNYDIYRYANEIDFSKEYHVPYYYNKSNVVAIMGNVAYPLKPYAGMSSVSKTLLEQTDLAFEFNLGQLSLTPSRESIHYDPITVNNIDIVLSQFIDKGKVYILEALKDCDCLFNLHCMINRIERNKILQLIIYSGCLDAQKIGEYTILEARNLQSSYNYTDFDGYTIHRYTAGKLSRKRRYQKIHINAETEIYFDDIKKSGPALIEYTEGNYNDVYLFKKDKEFDSTKHDEPEDIIKRMGLKTVNYSSSLPKPVRNHSTYVRKATGTVKLLRLNSRISSYLTFCWDTVQASSVDPTGYYVIVDGNYIVYNGEKKHPGFLRELTDTFKDPQMKVYGIGKLSVKNFPKLTHLLDPKIVEGKLKKYFDAAYGKGDKQDLANYEKISNLDLLKVKDSISKSGILGKFLESAEKGKNIKFKYEDAHLFKKFNIDVGDYFNKETTDKDLKQLYKTYPFLFLSQYGEEVKPTNEHKISYISLVDKGAFK